MATLKDGWAKTSDFLQDPKTKPSATTRNLYALLIDDQGMFGLGPSDLVFFEKSSTLVDTKSEKITSWWASPAKVEPKWAKVSSAAA